MTGGTDGTGVDYVVLSHVIVDDLRFAAGGERRGVLGGAGTYAAAGLRLAAGRVGIACGVGEDFAGSAHAAWFATNDIDTTGLEARGPRTPRSTVVYHREDTRTETPVFGHHHFARMTPRIDRLPASYRAARGYYIFRDHDAAFWREAAALRAASRAVVLWELHAAAADPARWPAVADRLAEVDLVSLNLAEARRLCAPLGARAPARPVPGRQPPEGLAQELSHRPGAGVVMAQTGAVSQQPWLAEAHEIAARLLATGVGGVALRLGAHGAMLARPPAQYRHIPACPATVVDTTGAGNAFGGALLAAVAAGEDWLSAGCGAAAAASLMLAQHGPPPRLDARRGEWRRRRDTLLASVHGGATAGAKPVSGARGSGAAPGHATSGSRPRAGGVHRYTGSHGVPRESAHGASTLGAGPRGVRGAGARGAGALNAGGHGAGARGASGRRYGAHGSGAAVGHATSGSRAHAIGVHRHTDAGDVPREGAHGASALGAGAHGAGGRRYGAPGIGVHAGAAR